MFNRKFAIPPDNGVGLTSAFVWLLVCGSHWNGREIVSPRGLGLEACGVWCFMSNSSLK